MKCRMKRFLEKIEMNRREMLKVVLAAPLGLLVEEEKEEEETIEPHTLVAYDKDGKYRWVQVSGWSKLRISKKRIAGVLVDKTF